MGIGCKIGNTTGLGKYLSEVAHMRKNVRFERKPAHANGRPSDEPRFVRFHNGPPSPQGYRGVANLFPHVIMGVKEQKYRARCVFRGSSISSGFTCVSGLLKWRLLRRLVFRLFRMGACSDCAILLDRKWAIIASVSIFSVWRRRA